MTPAFEGTALVTLDAKGRFAVPALFRDALLGSEQTSDTGSTPGTVVLTRHPDGCLVVYPESVWRIKREKLAALPYSARAFVRLVLGSARTIAADRAARLLVPADLRTLAGIERNAVLIGLGAHLELWPREAYVAMQAEAFNVPLETADFTS